MNPTIKDIAAQLGMSHSTVSRALNGHPHISDETKSRVRRVAEQLGYIANSGARLMRHGRSNLIGLVVPDVENAFYTTAAKIIAQKCADHGYQLVFAVSDDNPLQEQLHIKALREARVAGIVLAASARPRKQTLDLLRDVPVVQFIRNYSRIRTEAVVVDDHQGTLLAAQHLIALGHRRIAYVGGIEELSTGRHRLAGYISALRQSKLEYVQSLVKLGTPRPELGRDAVRALLQQKRKPTALLLASSQITVGALDAISEAGLAIPQDLSVVAHGDPDWYRLWRPAITTIGLPLAQIATSAASILFQRLENTGDANGAQARGQHAPFQPSLIIRQSTRKLVTRT